MTPALSYLYMGFETGTRAVRLVCQALCPLCHLASLPLALFYFWDTVDYAAQAGLGLIYDPVMSALEFLGLQCFI